MKSPADPITLAGVTMTVGEQILRYLRAGAPKVEAAAAAGIGHTTLYQWLRIGADASSALARAELAGLPAPDLDDRAMACLAFASDVDQVIAEWEVRNLGVLSQLAAGTLKTKRTVERRDGNGQVLERVVTEETMLPDARAITWMLERRAPQRWGPPAVLVGIGVDAGVGAAVAGATRAVELAGQVREYRAAIEATASEPDGG